MLRVHFFRITFKTAHDADLKNKYTYTHTHTRTHSFIHSFIHACIYELLCGCCPLGEGELVSVLLSDRVLLTMI